MELLPYWLPFHGCVVAFYAAFAAYVYVRRPPPSLRPVLFWTQVAALTWALGDLLAILSPSEGWKWPALMLLYSGSIPVASLWWLLALRFAEVHDRPLRWGRSRWVYAPLAFAGLMWLALMTNPLHEQFLSVVVGGRQQYHWMWWATSLTNHAVCIAACAVYFHLARLADIPARARSQADVLFAASLAGLVAQWMAALMPGIWPVDLAIVSAALTGGLYLYGIYRTGLFDLSPVTVSEVLESDPGAVLVIDGEGRARFANAAAHRVLPDVALAPDRDVVAALAPRLREWQSVELPAEGTAGLVPFLGRGPSGSALFRLDGDGAWLWIEHTPLSASGGRALRCLRLHDISDVARMSLRLEQAKRIESLGALAGGIAHELSQPMASIRGLAEIELDEGAPTEERGRRWARIVSEARRGARLVENVQELARQRTGARPQAPLVAALRQAAARCADLVKAHDAELRVELPRTSAIVAADAVQLEQIVDNLVANALQNGGPGTCVTLRAHCSDGTATLVVSDDGPGMSEEVRRRAFEPFYSTRRDHGGTGLGLALVRSIAYGLGGHAALRSEPGAGCAVEVRLPVFADRGLSPAD